VTGFVEKHFKGETLVREFALGGRKNGVDEAVAKARFNGVGGAAAPPKPTPPRQAKSGLPDFITQSDPMMRGKSAKPKAQPAPPKKVVKPDGARAPVRGPVSRRDSIALAGGLSTKS
jgi:hypothetical protein